MENILQKTLEISPESLEEILDMFIIVYQTNLFSEKVNLTGERDPSIFKDNRIEIQKIDKSILYYVGIYLKSSWVGNLWIFPINQNRTNVKIELYNDILPPYSDLEYLEYKETLEDLRDQILGYTNNSDQDNENSSEIDQGNSSKNHEIIIVDPKRQDRMNTVKELSIAGKTITDIAIQVDMSEATVKRYRKLMNIRYCKKRSNG
jgi:hypothetical protein